MTKPRLGIAFTAAFGALVAAVVGFRYGIDLHHKHVSHNIELTAYISAAAFVVLGIYSIRRMANQLAKAVSKADRSAASIVRLLVTVAGSLVILLISLAMLRIDASQLLLGGAITGIVIGIAAQQSMGNMFAGIVLLVAHPFRAGDHVRVRTGSLGGPFEGHVVSMGLTYVIFSTDEGTTLVPNLTMLASGIVRNPAPLPPSAPTAGAPVPTMAAEPAGPPTPATDEHAGDHQASWMRRGRRTEESS